MDRAVRANESSSTCAAAAKGATADGLPAATAAGDSRLGDGEVVDAALGAEADAGTRRHPVVMTMIKRKDDTRILIALGRGYEGV
jgi:hypothetical protein